MPFADPWFTHRGPASGSLTPAGDVPEQPEVGRGRRGRVLGRLSIPQRILVQVAIGAGLVIAVATAVTYTLVFNASKQRDLRHLDLYVAERSQREETGFQQIAAKLTLVRGQFLKRMEAPIPAGKPQSSAPRISAMNCSPAGWTRFPAFTSSCPVGRTSDSTRAFRPGCGRPRPTTTPRAWSGSNWPCPPIAPRRASPGPGSSRNRPPGCPSCPSTCPSGKKAGSSVPSATISSSTG